MYTSQYQQSTNTKQPFCYDDPQSQSQVGQQMGQIAPTQAIPGNMVMIDQAQLMELLAAKQILDA